ncbi:MAG: hypothetical protein ACRC35_05590 [Angustibacter sp.]
MADTCAAVFALTAYDGLLREEAWDCYRDSMTELQGQTLENHVFTREEFDTIAADPRYRTVLVREPGGTMCAIAIATNELASIPWLDEQFFRSRWPEHHSQGQCWYVVSVGTRPRARDKSTDGASLFALLVHGLLDLAEGAESTFFLDAPGRNIEIFDLPRAAQRAALKKIPEVGLELVDTQTYWAYSVPAVAREVDVRSAQDRVDLRQAEQTSTGPTDG